jgi:molecular chaperone HtpG
MMEQQKMGGAGFYGAFPEMYNLHVNANHPIISSVLTKNEEDQKATIKQLTDLALLAQGMLKGEALNTFIERNIDQIA